MSLLWSMWPTNKRRLLWLLQDNELEKMQAEVEGLKQSVLEKEAKVNHLLLLLCCLHLAISFFKSLVFLLILFHVSHFHCLLIWIAVLFFLLWLNFCIIFYHFSLFKPQTFCKIYVFYCQKCYVCLKLTWFMTFWTALIFMENSLLKCHLIFEKCTLLACPCFFLLHRLQKT